MQSTRLNYALLGVLVLALVVPTGAVVSGSGGSDQVWESHGVTLQPASGPNGQYAHFDSEGNLTVDLSDPGVNLNATTRVGAVFAINNTGSENATVWLTHDGTEAVTLLDSVHGTPIEGARNSLQLAGGERILVGIRVRTYNASLSPGDAVLESIQLHAELPENQPTTTPEPTTPTGPPTEPEQTTPSETTTTTTTEPPTPPGENESVSVDFGSQAPPPNASIQVQELDPSAVQEPPNTTKPGPTAIIDRSVTPEAERGEELDERPPQTTARVNNTSTTVDAVTNVGQTLELEGDQSLLDRSDSIDIDRRIAKTVNIDVPSNYERRSATVQIRIDRSKFEDTQPENARIGHWTENGWRLLDTQVVESNDQSVLLQARTRGFSPFAVFRTPDVKYEWTLPNGTTHTGPRVRSAFNEPGVYNVTLTVTDARGRSDTTRHRVLVNDPPTVSIEGPETVPGNESVTLRANVTNQYGNATVTWLLPDGRQATGTELTTTLPEGAQQVSVRVEDEYGANATNNHTLFVGVTPSEDSQRLLIGNPGQLAGLLALCVIVLAVILVFAVMRSGFSVPRPKLPIPWRRSRAPRIVEFENPHWEPTDGRFKIDVLEIRDPDDDLSTVEISLHQRNGEELACKTIDIRGTDRYRAVPASIPGLTISDLPSDDVYVAEVRAVDNRNHERRERKPIDTLVPDQSLPQSVELSP